MSEMTTIYNDMQGKMDKSITALKQELLKVRTGKANINILDDIMVDYYGQPTPLNQVGTITIPEARMIVIKPWEKTLVPVIERAILASNLGVTPQNDGTIVRLQFPALTEDRRKNLVKDVRKYGEDAKVAIRNIRRNFNDVAKKMEKNSEISEDSLKDALDTIQEKTNTFVGLISDIISAKEREIMEI